jgi:hypothetical protein
VCYPQLQIANSSGRSLFPPPSSQPWLLPAASSSFALPAGSRHPTVVSCQETIVPLCQSTSQSTQLGDITSASTYGAVINGVAEAVRTTRAP